MGALDVGQSVVRWIQRRGLETRRRAARSGRLTCAPRVAALIALLALLAAASGTIARAEDPVTMQATAGFEGRGRLGSWGPVVVEVQNDGPDLAGELRVLDTTTRSSYGGPLGYSAQYVAEAVLPHGARKRFNLFAPLNNPLTVQLVDQDKVLASVDATVQVVGQGDLLAGVVSRRTGVLAALGATSLPGGGRQLVVARLRPQDLPAAPEGFESLDLLALDDFDSSDLSTEQISALEGWVSQGGTLFVAGGPEWRRTLAGLPGSLRPVEVDGTVDLDGLSALANLTGGMAPNGRVVVARGAVRSGRALATQDGVPLIVQATVGSGSVVFLAFDPSLEPLASWSVGTRFWEELLARALPAEVLAPAMQGGPPGWSYRNPGQLGWVLGNLPALDLPPTGMLLGLLASYVLLIGPVNYVVLRRLRRRTLAWATIPVLAVAFGAGFYLVAFQGKGSAVLTHTVSIVRLSPGSPEQHVQSYVGVFAPTETSYRLTIASSALVSSIGDQYYSGSGGPPAGDVPAGIRIRREVGRSVVDLVGMEMWSMRGIAVEEHRQGEGAVAADLRVQGRRLVGTVTNGLGWDLQDVAVVAGDGYQQLGDLAAGQSVPVDFALSAAVWYGPKAGPSVLQQIYAMPSSASPPDREQMRRSQIVSSLFNPGSPPEEPFLLAGWSSHSPVALGIEGWHAQEVQTSLVLMPLHPGFEGAIDLPAGLLRGKLVAAEKSQMGWTPGGFQLSEGSVTMQFDLAAAGSSQLDELTVDVPVMGSLPTSPLLDAQLYNWLTGQWDAATVSTASLPSSPPGTAYGGTGGRPVPVPAPAYGAASYAGQSYAVVCQGAEAIRRYVAEDGLLRVKLVKNNRDAIYLGQVSVALKGRAGQ